PGGRSVNIDDLGAGFCGDQRMFERLGGGVLFGRVGVNRDLALALRNRGLVERLQLVDRQGMAFAGASAADIDTVPGFDELLQELSLRMFIETTIGRENRGAAADQRNGFHWQKSSLRSV